MADIFRKIRFTKDEKLRGTEIQEAKAMMKADAPYGVARLILTASLLELQNKDGTIDVNPNTGKPAVNDAGLNRAMKAQTILSNKLFADLVMNLEGEERISQEAMQEMIKELLNSSTGLAALKAAGYNVSKKDVE
jgi:hypothetical protein